jgi:hypothetical protein
MTNIKIICCILLLTIPITFSLSEKDLIQKATDEFNLYVPTEFRHEYVFSEISSASERDGTHKIIWIRKINNIPIFGDRVVIQIYDENGSIDSKYIRRVQNISEFALYYTLNSDQAQFTVSQYIAPIIFDEGLQFMDGKLFYLYKIEGGNAVRVDAQTGYAETYASVIGSGYSADGTAQFNPTDYYLDRYGPYGVIGLVAVTGLIYLKFRHHEKPKGHKK